MKPTLYDAIQAGFGKAVFTVHHDKFALAKHPWYEPDSVAHTIAERHNIRLLDRPIGTVVAF